jgi:hypothetical protein
VAQHGYPEQRRDGHERVGEQSLEARAQGVPQLGYRQLAGIDLAQHRVVELPFLVDLELPRVLLAAPHVDADEVTRGQGVPAGCLDDHEAFLLRGGRAGEDGRK